MGSFNFFGSTLKAWKTVKGYGVQYGTFAYTNARWIGWIAITTTMLTFLPLFIETAREAEMEAMEQASIEEGLARGETPFEMAQGKGLQGAVDPDVISKA